MRTTLFLIVVMVVSSSCGKKQYCTLGFGDCEAMFANTGDSSSNTADNCQDGVSSGSLKITKVSSCKISTGATYQFSYSGGTSPYTYSASCTAGSIDSGNGKFTATAAGSIGGSGDKVQCSARVTDNNVTTDPTYFYVQEP